MAKIRRTVDQILTRYEVVENGCWKWTGYCNHLGYGRAMITVSPGVHKLKAVHRLAYEHHHGPIPDGAVVMHVCDNPPCINPEHLKTGTQAENLDDAWLKGRVPTRPPPVKRPYSPPTLRKLSYKEALTMKVLGRVDS